MHQFFSKERRTKSGNAGKWWGALGIIVALILAVIMHQTVKRHGYQVISDRALSEASLIVELTGNFVETYSLLSVNHSDVGLPNPATFRANALRGLAASADEQSLFSTTVVGLPGREIASKAQDQRMGEMLTHLELNPSVTNVSEVKDLNGIATHRSVWSFKASQQACADCHNRLQNLQGTQRWQVGDLMGAQVVEQNIQERQLNIDHVAIVQTLLLFIAILAAWFCCFYLVNQLRLNKKLTALATIDPLSGCLNRRELYARVEKLSGITDGAVLMLDLDNFKSINDTYGHNAGDQVIKDFSEHIHQNIRKNDWAARIGGEEFVVWLPDIKPIDAIQLAERVLVSAQQSELIVDGNCISYTASIGLNVVKNSTPNLFDHWLQAADTLLYRAKDEGRNRIVCEVSTYA